MNTKTFAYIAIHKDYKFSDETPSILSCPSVFRALSLFRYYYSRSMFDDFILVMDAKSKPSDVDILKEITNELLDGNVEFRFSSCYGTTYRETKEMQMGTNDSIIMDAFNDSDDYTSESRISDDYSFYDIVDSDEDFKVTDVDQCMTNALTFTEFKENLHHEDELTKKVYSDILSQKICPQYKDLIDYMSKNPNHKVLIMPTPVYGSSRVFDDVIKDKKIYKYKQVIFSNVLDYSLEDTIQMIQDSFSSSDRLVRKLKDTNMTILMDKDDVLREALPFVLRDFSSNVDIYIPSWEKNYSIYA
ncbi:hypothetical protein BPT24_104 [Tenacibaculum phage pT24]|uniref:Uncharacterized protein n=1 Tax=Tenacibaculum phage pT24 TaxID=1880590 RepID=A0A1B4XWQ5_9CAUD|nr:hypothetical protein HYP10_gp104 [Tenacibaculum phage pT24]BAV39229.1 hypothetical protein BPT24_104 [Tenacibaculum phage pT24]